DPSQSGLIDAFRRLRRVHGVGTIVLDAADVVRHTLVQRVIEAYGEADAASNAAGALQRALDAELPDREDG
ncbi:MAG: hypothetical protein AAF747_02620, partial [Planctomycetota bacterium]